jgi:hypothetical protein
VQDSSTISFATVTVRKWIPLCETCFWDATPPWMPGESDPAKRVNGRVQITTDALTAYVNVIEGAPRAVGDFVPSHKV